MLMILTISMVIRYTFNRFDCWGSTAQTLNPNLAAYKLCIPRFAPMSKKTVDL